MSLWQNWIDGFLGRSKLDTKEPDDEPVRAELDAQQEQIASRLSKLTGISRDKVLAAAYRKADAALTRKRK